VSAPPADRSKRIAHIELDEHTVLRRNPDVEHERSVAIFDLLEDNTFSPIGHDGGPFHLRLGIEDNRLILDIRDTANAPIERVVLPLAGFRGIVKDYFMICESYYKAIRNATPSQIETIDMARRGLHNEGSEALRDRLGGKVEIDFDTARRLFTLVCVLHWRR
jgi:uncharacterized protein (UPF0262 family)